MEWSATPLGPLAAWPNNLRTTRSLCLSSNFPINIVWGPSYNQIYATASLLPSGAPPVWGWLMTSAGRLRGFPAQTNSPLSQARQQRSDRAAQCGCDRQGEGAPIPREPASLEESARPSANGGQDGLRQRVCELIELILYCLTPVEFNWHSRATRSLCDVHAHARYASRPA
jgi:hypothetical protein